MNLNEPPINLIMSTENAFLNWKKGDGHDLRVQPRQCFSVRENRLHVEQVAIGIQPCCRLPPSETLKGK